VFYYLLPFLKPVEGGLSHFRIHANTLSFHQEHESGQQIPVLYKAEVQAVTGVLNVLG